MANARRATDPGLLAALLLAAASPAVAGAASLYGVTETDGVTTVTSNYSNLMDAVDLLSRARLVSTFRPGNPAFNPDFSAFSVNMAARGLGVGFQSAQGSPAITMSIPSIGFTGTFTGNTREDSLQAIREWFKKNGGRFLGELAKKNAELSPVDPLAGNPNSAQARTVNTSFDRGFGRLAAISDGQGGTASPDAAKNANTVTVGAQYRAGMGPYGSGSYTLPLGYSWRFNDDARHQISFDVPLTYQSVEGGHVYGLGIGAGYSHPLNDYWVLTAGVDYGLATSNDLGANGHLITGTVTSLLTLPAARWLVVHVGNMIGESSTLSMTVGDYRSDPGIRNTIMKNGLMLYFPTPRLLRSSGVEVFAADTRFFGAALYDSGYTEIGTSFGFSKVTVQGGTRYDSVLRIGVTGLIARGNNGIILNTGYFF